MNFFSNCCFVKIMKRNSRYKIYNFHIANSAICILEVGDVPSGDVLVTVSTKCFSKQKVRIKNSISCTTEIAYFWFAQWMIYFQGVWQKWKFPRGEGSILWADFGKSRREGGIGKIPSVGDYGYFLDELRPSKWYRCGRENPVSYRKPRFRGRRVLEQVKVLQIPMTKADLFLRIFEAIPGT